MARITRKLRQVPGVRTVILIGSQSRGDASNQSDIDVLVVSDEMITFGIQASLVGAGIAQPSLSLITYSVTEFGRLYAEGSLFVAHVLQEGKVLFDDGYFSQLRRNHFEISKQNLGFQWAVLKQRLNMLDFLPSYGRIFVECLGQIYPIAKNIAIISLASRGEFLFNKEKALDKFADRYPSLSRDIAEIRTLRAFSLLWAGARPTALPFLPLDCPDAASYYVDKLKKMMEMVEDNERQKGNSVIAV